MIDGPIWFAAAVVICGAHAIFLWRCRREDRQRVAWWRAYEERSQERHDAFMRAMRDRA